MRGDDSFDALDDRTADLVDGGSGSDTSSIDALGSDRDTLHSVESSRAVARMGWMTRDDHDTAKSRLRIVDASAGSPVTIVDMEIAGHADGIYLDGTRLR